MVGALVSIVWLPPLRGIFLRWFAARYKLNLDEAEYPLSHYRSIQDLFTRKLKPGLRPIADARAVHPADGVMSVACNVTDGKILQVKGVMYSVQELLGEKGAASEFEGGTALTYYLCPTDYHRVHSSVDGKVTQVRYIPGALWPVNGWSVGNIKRLFVRNERVVFWIRTAYGPVALVMVGATNVGKISVSFDPQIVTNAGNAETKKIYDPEVQVTRGEELGVFHMGSSAVVLYPKGFNLEVSGAIPRPVRMGGAVD